MKLTPPPIPTPESVEKKQPLIEHMLELRRRLMYAIAAFMVAFIACIFVADDIYAFLVIPLAEVMAAQSAEHHTLIATGMAETFFTYIVVAAFAGFVVSFPIIAIQTWLFISPGLYRDEKRAFLPYLLAIPVLFAAGASMAYYIVFPMAWEFFVSFENPNVADNVSIELMPRVSQYLSIVMQLIIAFGLSFQLPVVLSILARLGIVSAAWLRQSRKYALVFILIAAAILTPPDIASQVILAIPLYMLYEISIWIASGIERKKRRAAAASAP